MYGVRRGLYEHFSEGHFHNIRGYNLHVITINELGIGRGIKLSNVARLKNP